MKSLPFLAGRLQDIFKRPAHSIVFITEAKSFRLDTDRKGAPISELAIFDFGCDSVKRLAKTLPRLFEGRQPGRSVWLLFEGLDNEIISLSSVQVEGAGHDVLEQALTLEYEALGAVEGGQAAVAYRDVADEDGMRLFWIQAMPQSVLDDLDRLVKRHGAKLSGVLHPGALPLPLMTDGQPERWLRLEAWSKQLLLVWQTPEHGGRLQPFSAGDDWQQETETWLAEQEEPFDHTETLLNNRIELLPETGARWILNQPDQIVSWLSRWIIWLRQNKETALLRKKTKLNMDVVYMTASGGGALALCMLHAGVTWWLTQDYRAEADRLESLDKQLTQYTQESGKNQQEMDKIQQQIDRRAEIAKILPKANAALKQRWYGLMQTLAQATPEGVLIDGIVSQPDALHVTGISLRPDLPDLLASALNSRLQPLGWIVGMPDKTDLALLDQGGPWDFSLPINDVGTESL